MGAPGRAGQRAPTGPSRGAALPGLRKALVPRAGPGGVWGRAESAPPSGIWVGILSGSRVPAEVCVHVTALGGEALDSDSSRRGSASVNPPQRWELGCSAGGGQRLPLRLPGM